MKVVSIPTYPGNQYSLHCILPGKFSWVPNCLLGYPECEKNLSLNNFRYGLCENATPTRYYNKGINPKWVMG